MKVSFLFCFIALAVLSPMLSRAANADGPAEKSVRYVKIEVKGKLTNTGKGYAVQDSRYLFPEVEVLVPCNVPRTRTALWTTG